MVRQLFLWMMPSTIFLVLSTWFSGLLNINHLFTASSFAILLYNFSFLFIGLGLSFALGPLSYGVGALIAALIMVVFLYVNLKKQALYTLKPLYKQTQDTKAMWKLALPILFGGASLQFYFVLHRIVAASLDERAIAAVNYASKLTSFPQAILMTAVTTVIYPLLSKMEGKGDRGSIRKLYKKGLLYLILLLVPATVIAYFFADFLVAIVFGHGNYTVESVEFTVPIFKAFTLSMLFLAANTYITRFYYAKGNSIIPVLFSLINVFGVNLCIIYLLIDTYEAVAIAYGTAISAATNFIMLQIYARWKWKLAIFEKIM